MGIFRQRNHVARGRETNIVASTILVAPQSRNTAQNAAHLKRSCRLRIASMWWARCVALAGPRAGNAIASGDGLELSDALPGIRGVTSYVDRVVCRATWSVSAGLVL